MNDALFSLETGQILSKDNLHFEKVQSVGLSSHKWVVTI